MKNPVDLKILLPYRLSFSRSLIVFLVSVPGLAIIFCVVFGTAKVDFWCEDNNDDDNDLFNSNVTNKSITINQCQEGCQRYSFDNSFWKRTVITDFQLVCDRAYVAGQYTGEGDFFQRLKFNG